mmetsp:Transcript_10393/g.20915  ORF Transcript_10393/g.20915 Transcript_10393/m.20915 type:complete len:220 (+) Transcript_10393:886-1545(+)
MLDWCNAIDSSTVTGTIAREYKMVRAFAIRPARSVRPSIVNITTVFCAGGIQLSSRIAKLTTARARLPISGRRPIAPRRCTVARPPIGARINLANRIAMIVRTFMFDPPCFGDDGSPSSSELAEPLLLPTRLPANTSSAAGRYADPSVFIAPKNGDRMPPFPSRALLNGGTDPATRPSAAPVTGGLKNFLSSRPILGIRPVISLFESPLLSYVPSIDRP